MKRDLYFKELAVVLGRAGFTPLPQENDFLPVEYQGQRLCRVNAQGNVFYRQEEVDSPEREQARVKVTDMAGTVLEYMRHLEHAPTIQAMGLSEPYQALAEFNGTVLAGRLTSSGAKFVTWDWDFNHTGLNHGHLSEDMDLTELNLLAEKLASLEPVQEAAFEGLVRMDLDKGMTELPLCRLVDLANSADCCHVAPGVGNDEQLGHFYVDNDFPVIPPGLPEEVYEVLDYAAIGEVFAKPDTFQPGEVEDALRIEFYSSSTVLITGPSGTGKELFARAIHKESNRKNQPFVAINCAAIPDTLLESELFGYVKGAFTGADPKGKVGKIELANHGVLFLDEIGDMPLYIQAKVLRALEQHEIVRLGANISTEVDVRFLAATNKNLEAMIQQKMFREDLFYRLNVIPLSIPALKDRREDIPLLTNFFVTKYSGLLQKNICGIAPETEERLRNYEWPGNVRELENTVEYMINMAEDGEVLTNDTLPPGLFREEGSVPGYLERLEDMERYAIQRALKKYGNHYEGKQKAAHTLGIGVATLYRKMKKYGLDT